MTPATDTAPAARSKRVARPKPNLNQRKLIDMLTENTGASFLDSGGAYGRHHERNQRRDFMAEPATVLEPVADYMEDGSDYAPTIVHNVFGFLSEAVYFDSAMDRRYQAFARKHRRDEYEMTIMDMFMNHLRSKGHKIGGLYGEGDPMTVNTYNGEDALSQTLQYLYFNCDGTEYVLLQIHGGCDVRGGYTAAKAFQAGDDGTSIFDNAKATIWTAEPEPGAETAELFSDRPRGLWERPYWYSENAGYSWYRDGESGHGAGRELQTFPISRDLANKAKGTHVYVDADGLAYCPHTGLRLIAGF